MQFQQINAFKAVYELGTVTAAADFIHITQPAVSRLIASLERKIGFRLFERVKGRLLPTDKGKVFYMEVAKAYDVLASLEDSAQDIKNRTLGNLNIAAFPMLSSHFLPTLLGRFLQKQHNIHASLKTYRSEEVLRRTALQACDIGFSMQPDVTDGVNSTKITSHCVCILPKNSPLADKEYITPNDLVHTDMIKYEQDRTQQLVDKAFHHAKIKPREIAEVSLAVAIASLVADGIGAAIVDPFTAYFSPLQQDRLIVKAFKPDIPFDFYILLPTRRIKSELTDSFVQQFFATAHAFGITLEHT